MNLDKDTIAKLKKAGMIRGKFDDYIALANEYFDRLSENGGRKMDAIYCVSERKGASIDTVIRAIKAVRHLT